MLFSGFSLFVCFIVVVVYHNHPKGCEVVSLYVWVCISLVISGAEHFFHILIGHLYMFFGAFACF